MCGRYSLCAPPKRIEDRFGATFATAFRPRYNAAPGQSLPVVTDSESGTLGGLEWGFVPPWADRRAEFGFINARAETVAEKPTFRTAFAGSGATGAADTGAVDEPGEVAVGRCLVPADGFYEWVDGDTGAGDGSSDGGRGDGGSQPYRVRFEDDRLFAMAGLWARWQPPTTQTGLDAFGDGPVDPDPDPVETFAVVTTEPNDLVADLHHRMAVILPREAETAWLRADADRALSLLEPYPAEGMSAYPVSEAVNDPSNDSPAVTERVETG
jgi:putative SOS response-associated peptidase YedK